MKQPIYDNLLVEVTEEWRSEIQGKYGIVGVVYENDIMRLDGAQTKGIVRALPRGASQDHWALQHYNPLDLADIHVGDIVYFHFNEITPDSRADREKLLYTVAVCSVYCRVRNGEIRMLGGKILAEPIYDAQVDKATGARFYTNQNGLHGLVTKLKMDRHEKHNTSKAKLAHIGLPLMNAKRVDISVGDTFYYDKDSDLALEIEGKTYLVMEQENILMTEHETR